MKNCDLCGEQALDLKHVTFDVGGRQLEGELCKQCRSCELCGAELKHAGSGASYTISCTPGCEAHEEPANDLQKV